MKPSKEIANYTNALNAARLAPVTEKAQLEAFSADCERRVAEPIGNDATARIRARLDLTEARKAIEEFREWAIEPRQRAAAESYLQHNAPEICEILNVMIAERAKAQPGFIEAKLKQAAEITINLFASKTDRYKIYQERERIELAAEDAEATVEIARAAVRRFELAPDEQAFSEAAARVAEIKFPLVPVI